MMLIIYTGLDGSGSNMGRKSDIGLPQGGGIGSDMDATDQANSRPGSSRPISSRPTSSRNRIGSGVGNRRSSEGKNKKGGISTSMDVRIANTVISVAIVVI